MVGQFGMRMAVQANVRVASASRRSFGEALKLLTVRYRYRNAYRRFRFTWRNNDFHYFWCSITWYTSRIRFWWYMLASFMRVGGRYLYKSSDVGADLVGKVEAGSAGRWWTNAAVIADLVGDNVGDCARMAADIFWIIWVTIVSNINSRGCTLHPDTSAFMDYLPMLVRGIGVLSSIIGTYLVKGSKSVKATIALNQLIKGLLFSARNKYYGVRYSFIFLSMTGAHFLSVVVDNTLLLLLDEITNTSLMENFHPVKILRRREDRCCNPCFKGYELLDWSCRMADISNSINNSCSVMIYYGQPYSYVLYELQWPDIRYAYSHRQQCSHGCFSDQLLTMQTGSWVVSSR